MRTSREIYAQYKILPNLQVHQLRVAAVGKLICDNFKESVNTRDVVLACLFHDMGNILKFDLTVYPDAVQPEGIAYWEAVKADFRSRYGNDQHEASEAIAREIGLSVNVRSCIGAVVFSKAEETLSTGTWEQKICEYADSRVSPSGVLSLDERLREARERYKTRNVTNRIAIEPQERFETIVRAQKEMERQIFSETAIQPEHITDTAVAPLIEQLWEYPVHA